MAPPGPTRGHVGGHFGGHVGGHVGGRLSFWSRGHVRGKRVLEAGGLEAVAELLELRRVKALAVARTGCPSLSDGAGVPPSPSEPQPVSVRTPARVSDPSSRDPFFMVILSFGTARSPHRHVLGAEQPGRGGSRDVDTLALGHPARCHRRLAGDVDAVRDPNAVAGAPEVLRRPTGRPGPPPPCR